jgi:hypothetical protein
LGSHEEKKHDKLENITQATIFEKLDSVFDAYKLVA